MATHYEVLGVGRDATDEEIRQAYLRRARELHPDVRSGAPAGGEMHEVNEAWRVLRTAASRQAYDRALTPPPVVDPEDVPFPRALAEPDDVGVRVVRGLPWIVAAVVLAVIFVFTAFAGGDDRPPSGFDLAGKCVHAGEEGIEETECGDGVDEVVLVVSRQSQCPSGAAATPYADDWLCLRPFVR